MSLTSILFIGIVLVVVLATIRNLRESRDRDRSLPAGADPSPDGIVFESSGDSGSIHGHAWGGCEPGARDAGGFDCGSHGGFDGGSGHH